MSPKFIAEGQQIDKCSKHVVLYCTNPLFWIFETIILTQPYGLSAALAVVVLALIRQAREEALDLGTDPHLLTSQFWVG